MNTTRNVYPDATLRFVYKYEDLYVYIPDEFTSLYSISISDDGYLVINR